MGEKKSLFLDHMLKAEAHAILRLCSPNLGSLDTALPSASMYF